MNGNFKLSSTQISCYGYASEPKLPLGQSSSRATNIRIVQKICIVYSSRVVKLEKYFTLCKVGETRVCKRANRIGGFVTLRDCVSKLWPCGIVTKWIVTGLPFTVDHSTYLSGLMMMYYIPSVIHSTSLHILLTGLVVWYKTLSSRHCSLHLLQTE